MQSSQRTPFLIAMTMLTLTTLQVTVATFVNGLPKFEGKAFGARLVF